MCRRCGLAIMVYGGLAFLLGGGSTVRASEPVTGTVWLQLQVTGLPAEKCRVDIRPGHPACTFEPMALELKGQGRDSTVYLKPLPVQVTSIGADHDCTFAITIREPGQPARTYRRGLCLETPREGQPVESTQRLRIFLSAPSLAVRDLPVRR